MSIQASPAVRVVITDTNILINLTHIGRLDLLGKLPPYSFVVAEEVVKEVKESDQSQAVQTAISSGLLQVVQLTDPSALRIYAELIQFLGLRKPRASLWHSAEVGSSHRTREEDSIEKQLRGWGQAVYSIQRGFSFTQSNSALSLSKKQTTQRLCWNSANSC